MVACRPESRGLYRRLARKRAGHRGPTATTPSTLRRN